MKEIVEELNKNGYEAYIVGGFVRDYMLGMSSKDIDISTNAPINEIIKIFKGKGRAFKEYYAYHIDGEDGYSYDITTYRKELKYRRNKPIQLEIAPDLYTDLLRRDFTINTFAIDNKGLFVDLLGSKKHLDSKIIKVVGDTETKLTEDKTRIIRAIRFACTLDFELDKDICTFLENKKAYLLNEVPREYIKNELDKIFDSNGIEKFFYIIRRYDISKYFNISFNKIKKSYNKYGIWAQIETNLPFSKREKDIINTIKQIIERKNIRLLDLVMYNNDVIYNVASILGMEKIVKAYNEIRELHSIIDIDIDIETFIKYVKFEDIKSVYKLVERRIMEGYLINNRREIVRFIKDL